MSPSTYKSITESHGLIIGAVHLGFAPVTLSLVDKNLARQVAAPADMGVLTEETGRTEVLVNIGAIFPAGKILYDVNHEFFNSDGTVKGDVVVLGSRLFDTLEALIAQFRVTGGIVPIYSRQLADLVRDYYSVRRAFDADTVYAVLRSMSVSTIENYPGAVRCDMVFSLTDIYRLTNFQPPYFRNTDGSLVAKAYDSELLKKAVAELIVQNRIAKSLALDQIAFAFDDAFVYFALDRYLSDAVSLLKINDASVDLDVLKDQVRQAISEYAQEMAQLKRDKRENLSVSADQITQITVSWTNNVVARFVGDSSLPVHQLMGFSPAEVRVSLISQSSQQLVELTRFFEKIRALARNVDILRGVAPLRMENLLTQAFGIKHVAIDNIAAGSNDDYPDSYSIAITFTENPVEHAVNVGLRSAVPAPIFGQILKDLVKELASELKRDVLVTDAPDLVEGIDQAIYRSLLFALQNPLAKIGWLAHIATNPYAHLTTKVNVAELGIEPVSVGTPQAYYEFPGGNIPKYINLAFNSYGLYRRLRDKEALTPYTASIVDVLSGDVLKVRTDSAVVTLRLAGIKTPEEGNAFAEMAKQYAQIALSGGTAEVFISGEDGDGNKLAHVFVKDSNGEFLNLQFLLLSLGLAEVTDDQPEDYGEFARSLEQAFGVRPRWKTLASGTSPILHDMRAQLENKLQDFVAAIEFAATNGLDTTLAQAIFNTDNNPLLTYWKIYADSVYASDEYEPFFSAIYESVADEDVQNAAELCWKTYLAFTGGDTDMEMPAATRTVLHRWIRTVGFPALLGFTSMLEWAGLNRAFTINLYFSTFIALVRLAVTSIMVTRDTGATPATMYGEILERLYDEWIGDSPKKYRLRITPAVRLSELFAVVENPRYKSIIDTLKSSFDEQFKAFENGEYDTAKFITDWLKRELNLVVRIMNKGVVENYEEIDITDINQELSAEHIETDALLTPDGALATDGIVEEGEVILPKFIGRSAGNIQGIKNIFENPESLLADLDRDNTTVIDSAIHAKAVWDSMFNAAETALPGIDYMTPVAAVCFFEFDDTGIGLSAKTMYVYDKVIAMDIQKNRDTPVQTAVVKLANPFDVLARPGQHTTTENDKDFLSSLMPEPGMPVQLRLGYGAELGDTVVVMNGRIVDVKFGPVVEISVESHGADLIRPVFDKQINIGGTSYTIRDIIVKALSMLNSKYLGTLSFIAKFVMHQRLREESTESWSLALPADFLLGRPLTTALFAKQLNMAVNVYEPIGIPVRSKEKDVWAKVLTVIGEVLAAGKITTTIIKGVLSAGSFAGAIAALANPYTLIALGVVMVVSSLTTQFFRAQKYYVRQGYSVWDVVRDMQNRVPGYVAYIVNYDEGQRLFFGKPSFPYRYTDAIPKLPEEVLGAVTISIELPDFDAPLNGLMTYDNVENPPLLLPDTLEHAFSRLAFAGYLPMCIAWQLYGMSFSGMALGVTKAIKSILNSARSSLEEAKRLAGDHDISDIVGGVLDQAQQVVQRAEDFYNKYKTLLDASDAAAITPLHKNVYVNMGYRSIDSAVIYKAAKAIGYQYPEVLLAAMLGSKVNLVRFTTQAITELRDNGQLPLVADTYRKIAEYLGLFDIDAYNDAISAGEKTFEQVVLDRAGMSPLWNAAMFIVGTDYYFSQPEHADHSLTQALEWLIDTHSGLMYIGVSDILAIAEELVDLEKHLVEFACFDFVVRQKQVDQLLSIVRDVATASRKVAESRAAARITEHVETLYEKGYLKPFSRTWLVTSATNLVANEIFMDASRVATDVTMIGRSTLRGSLANLGVGWIARKLANLWNGESDLGKDDKGDAQVAAKVSINPFIWPEFRKEVLFDDPNAFTHEERVRIGASVLADHIRRTYSGYFMVLGIPELQPFDSVVLMDRASNMGGVVDVRKVIHHYGPTVGLATTVEPDMHVEFSSLSEGVLHRILRLIIGAGAVAATVAAVWTMNIPLAVLGGTLASLAGTNLPLLVEAFADSQDFDSKNAVLTPVRLYPLVVNNVALFPGLKGFYANFKTGVEFVKHMLSDAVKQFGWGIGAILDALSITSNSIARTIEQADSINFWYNLVFRIGKFYGADPLREWEKRVIQDISE